MNSLEGFMKFSSKLMKYTSIPRFPDSGLRFKSDSCFRSKNSDSKENEKKVILKENTSLTGLKLLRSVAIFAKKKLVKVKSKSIQ